VVQELRKCLIYKQSYSQFSAEIYQFLLPWQQGSVCRNLNHSEIDWPPKHPIWCKNLRLILHLSGFIVNIVCIFAYFSYHGNRSWTDTFGLHIGRPENPLFLRRSSQLSIVWPSLSALNSISFNSTSHALVPTHMPARSHDIFAPVRLLGRGTRPRRQRHKLWTGSQSQRKRPIEGRSLQTKTVARKSERDRLSHWPLPDESKIFCHEANSRTSERRSNRWTNKQANNKQAKAN